MSETTLLDHLASNDLFKDLDQATLKALDIELKLHHLNKDDVLFKQGDYGDSMYLLIRGRLVIRMQTADGREIVVGEESEPGTSIGEMALITGQSRVVTLFAGSDADLVKLSKVGFELLVKEQPHTLTDLAELASRRWRQTQLAVLLANLLGEVDAVALREIDVTNAAIPMTDPGMPSTWL